jgi:hypothetical protein
MSKTKGRFDFNSQNLPIDADMLEFLNSLNADEELREFIHQPLRPDPFLEYSFPFYYELLRNSLAILPRQSFGNDFAAEESLALVQEIGDGQLNVKWLLSVPLLEEKNAEDITTLFYKIEQFVIRPKIRELLAKNNLRRGLSLGKLSEIALQIGLKQEEINKIIKALKYGSQIELLICIESTRKRYEETNLCEEKLFKYFNLIFAGETSSVKKNSKNKFINRIKKKSN